MPKSEKNQVTITMSDEQRKTLEFALFDAIIHAENEVKFWSEAAQEMLPDGRMKCPGATEFVERWQNTIDTVKAILNKLYGFSEKP